MKTGLVCLFALLAILMNIADATPQQLLAVDANAASTITELALPIHGRSNGYLYLAATPTANAGLAARGIPFRNISLVSGEPMYLVLSDRNAALDRIRAAVPVLFEDGATFLTQLDQSQVELVNRLGGRLAWLPDKPYLLQPPVALDFPRSDEPDTFVLRLIEQVNQDSLRSRIQRLQDFRTRWAFTDSCRAAERYVYDYFVSLGLDSVALDSFAWNGDTMCNPVGVLRGSVLPNSYVVICGHVDSRSPETLNNAPGAEDDASGAALVMEMARVLSRERPEVSVLFLGEPGEEVGFIGAFICGIRLHELYANVIGVLNFDMIAWEGGRYGISLHYNDQSRSLAQFQGRMAEAYTDIDHDNDSGPYNSDQYAFQQLGFRATVGQELGTFDPHWHTIGDTLGNLSMPLLAGVTQATLAAAATIAVAPAPCENLDVYDLGSGGALQVCWQPSPSLDVAGYKLLWGRNSHGYTDSALVGRGTEYSITGLRNGTRIYVTVAGIDSAGHEGFPAVERSGVPWFRPVPPSNLVALPAWFAMRLCWLPNRELDLAGYNIYRTTCSGVNYVLVNSSPVIETTYCDSALLSDTTYYYYLTAVDTTGNESERSYEESGKPVTLDHGILLVDETRDGNGTPGNPSDAQVDDFYHDLLRGYQYTDWDAATLGAPLAGALGPYSTIVWHGDDIQQPLLSGSVPGLANYLSKGGRLWLVGWKPIAALRNPPLPYPCTLQAGQFARDFLHLSIAFQNMEQDFPGAFGRNGYPDITIDSTKLFASWHGRMQWVDAFELGDADTILAFDSYANSPGFEGKPVGVRWLNGPYKVVFFGFPLYYARDDQARTLALKVMQDLSEPYGVEEARVQVPCPTRLFAARPNPFGRMTSIEFALAEAQNARLAVYDVTGKLVRTLVDQTCPAGVQRSSWDGLSETGRRVAAGVYFYRLETPAYTGTRKLELTN